MSRELFTSWPDYQTAIDRILALARKRICIYDEDLGHLHLETPERIAMLKAALSTVRADCLRIALRCDAVAATPPHPPGTADHLQPQ